MTDNTMDQLTTQNKGTYQAQGSDDLMNLGPFIQSYVFNAQSDKPRIPFMPRLESIENDNNVPSPGLPMRATRSRAMMPVSVQQPTVFLKRIDQEISSGPVKSNNLPLKKRHWEPRKAVDKLPWISKKPKLLNEKQARIKRWLLANYVYCPRHRNAKVSSRLVLNRVIKNFGPMTQKALGYIMYHAFPGVERVKDTRRGHIFKGILGKRDISVRLKSLGPGQEEQDDGTDDAEKISQDGDALNCGKSDDSEDPPYVPPIHCRQTNDFRRETRGATRKDMEHGQVNDVELVSSVVNAHESKNEGQNEAVEQQQGPDAVKMETSDQGYDSNNSENDNHKRAGQNESNSSSSDENCASGEINIKKEHIDPEYEPLSSTDDGDELRSPGSPNIDTNAFLLHNPLTFPLLRRTLNASPLNTAAAATNFNPGSQRGTSSPGFLVCPAPVLKLDEPRQNLSPLMHSMQQRHLHSPQQQLRSSQLQYHVGEHVVQPPVPQRPQIFQTFPNSEQNMVHKMPQTLLEAQEQLTYLLSYIQMREKKFSNLEKNFCDVSNEFRKLSHTFKQFQAERAAFLDFMSPSSHGT